MTGIYDCHIHLNSYGNADEIQKALDKCKVFAIKYLITNTCSEKEFISTTHEIFNKNNQILIQCFGIHP